MAGENTATAANGETEVVTDFPAAATRPGYLFPQVAFNKTTLAESPAFWFAAGMLSAFVVLYFLKKA